MRDPVTLLSIVDVGSIDPEVQRVIGHVSKGGSPASVPAIFYVGRYHKRHKFKTATRILIVTSSDIITYKEDGSLSRAVPILAIKEAFVFPDMYNVLSIPSQHDFLFQLERPTDIDYFLNILQVIKKAYDPSSHGRHLSISSFSGSHTSCPKVNLTKKGKDAYPTSSAQIPFIKAVTSDLGSMDALLKPPKPPKEERGDLAVKEINARIGAVLTHPLFYPPSSSPRQVKPPVDLPKQESSSPLAIKDANTNTAAPKVDELPSQPTTAPPPIPTSPVAPTAIPSPPSVLETPVRQHLDPVHAPSIARSPVIDNTPYHSTTPTRALASPPPPPPPTPGPQQGYNHRIRVYTPLPSASVRHSSTRHDSPPRQTGASTSSTVVSPAAATAAPVSLPARPSVQSFEASIAHQEVSLRISLRQQAIDSRRGEVTGLMGLSGIQSILMVGAIQEELDELLQSQARDRVEKRNVDSAEESRRQASAAAEAYARATASLKAQQDADEAAAAAESEAALLHSTPARPTAPAVDPSTPEYAQWYYTQYLPFVAKMQTPGRQ